MVRVLLCVTGSVAAIKTQQIVEEALRALERGQESGVHGAQREEEALGDEVELRVEGGPRAGRRACRLGGGTRGLGDAAVSGLRGGGPGGRAALLRAEREADGLRELVLVRGLPPLRAARALPPLLLGGVGHLEVARLAQLRRVGAVVVERGVEAAEGRLPPPRPGAEPRLG